MHSSFPKLALLALVPTRALSLRWLTAIALCLVVSSVCHAQFGYTGRGLSGRSAHYPNNAFRYRGPLLSIELAPAYGVHAPAPSAIDPLPPVYSSRYGVMSDPWFGPSPYDAYPAPVFSLQFPSLFDTYRGVGPTAAELERERDYQTLDRMHRYQTREMRYESDFYNRYASPSAMVQRYSQPYVAGMPRSGIVPRSVPGTLQSRSGSRYEGYVADDQVARALRASANRLIRSLTAMADGHIWMRHLQPDRIIRVIDHNQSPAAVEDLVVNYLGVADTPRLALVAAAEGFADTSRLLQQFVTLPSVYPHAEVQANEFAGQQETILSERVIGEQVIGEQVNGNLAIDGPMLNAPTLAPPVQPADEVVTEEIGPREPAADQPRHSVAKPSLDDLPEPDDIELLPAPKADAE